MNVTGCYSNKATLVSSGPYGCCCLLSGAPRFLLCPHISSHDCPQVLHLPLQRCALRTVTEFRKREGLGGLGRCTGRVSAARVACLRQGALLLFPSAFPLVHFHPLLSSLARGRRPRCVPLSSLASLWKSPMMSSAICPSLDRQRCHGRPGALCRSEALAALSTPQDPSRPSLAGGGVT